jgi:LAO/AO transport system kinase
VGVGQSETVVAQMADVFLLLLAPAGGDELQGVKRGIMEIADLILINKADGDLKPAATRTCADYAGALRLLRKRPQDPEGYPKAQMVSALHDEGLAEVWADLEHLISWRKANGFWVQTRAAQARYWFQEEVRNALLSRLSQPDARRMLEEFAEKVASGAQVPGEAAQDFLDWLETKGRKTR